MMKHPEVRLNDGRPIPILGLGVYQSDPGETTQAAVRYAFEAGYRHIDTASMYQNEDDVGAAFRASGLARSDVFITTKLWYDKHGYDTALRACEASLKALGMDYVDLYLIHWPGRGDRKESWRALQKLKADGYCRSIGVSNYTVRHLDEMVQGTGELPVINQVEFSPFLYQKALHDFCRAHGIQLEAYGPLTQGKKLDHPEIARLAAKYGKSAAQVLIRWAVQHEIVVIPKSIKPARILENSQVFDWSFDAADLAALDALNEDFRTEWDPTDVL
jgi:diketogulonate reductase-like aldo/keto reductase